MRCQDLVYPHALIALALLPLGPGTEAGEIGLLQAQIQLLRAANQGAVAHPIPVHLQIHIGHHVAETVDVLLFLPRLAGKKEVEAVFVAAHRNAVVDLLYPGRSPVEPLEIVVLHPLFPSDIDAVQMGLQIP